jgi:hypothetical protein
MLFSSADVVWIYYRDQLGSSGVLVRAGQYSKPVIVSDLGLVGRIVVAECPTSSCDTDKSRDRESVSRCGLCSILLTQALHSEYR